LPLRKGGKADLTVVVGEERFEVHAWFMEAISPHLGNLLWSASRSHANELRLQASVASPVTPVAFNLACQFH